MKSQQSKFRVYYYILLGAFGGVSGWFVAALAFHGVSAEQISAEPSTLAVKGAAVGALIGLSIATYDGFASRSFRRFFKLGVIGLLLGALGGAVSLPLGQFVFDRLWLPAGAEGRDAFPLRSFLVGTLCWLILGGLIGLVEVIGKGTQRYKGLLGGILGGLVGGIIYELARAALPPSGENNNPPQMIQAISFALMGGAIGGSIALISTLLRSAWIVVLDGKLAGHEYDITKYVSRERGKRNGGGVIGSDELRVNIYLPADREVLPQHAVLRYVDESPTLSATPEAQKLKAKTLVNNYPISTWPLADKDKIQIGTTSLLYRQSRKGGAT